MSSIPGSSDYLERTGLDKTRIEESFRHSSKAIERTCQIISTIFQNIVSDTRKIRDFATDLKVWGFHYLVRDTKIPAFNHKGLLPLASHDYLYDNEAKYYRGDGGAVLKIFEDFFKMQHPFLAKHSIGLVNPSKFNELAAIACEHSEMIYYGGSYQYKCVDSITELKQLASEQPRSFLDVSPILKKIDLSDEASWKKTMEDIAIIVDSLPDETIVSGLLTVSHGVGVSVLFEPGQGRCDEAEDSIFGLFAQINNFKGIIGAYPEMLLLKRALFQQGFELHSLYQGAISCDESDVDANLQKPKPQSILPLLLIRLEELSREHAQNQLISLYLPILIQIVQSIKERDFEEFSNKKLNQIFENAESQSLRQMMLLIDQITDCLSNSSLSNEEKFTDILQNIYLLFEEIFFLMIPHEQSDNSWNLESALEKSFPFDPKLIEMGIQKRFFSFHSGMACHENIMKAQIEVQKLMNGDTRKTQLLFVKGSYTELIDDPGLKDYLQNDCDTEVLRAEEILTRKVSCDILLLDLHPNCISLKNVKTNPVLEIIGHLMRSRTKDQQPLTVVLDTTTGLISDPQVEAIVHQLRNEIAEGKLNFIIATSLAKFYNAGLDKYGGGLAICYGTERNPFSVTLNDKLEAFVKANPISKESRAFFFQLFSSCKKEIEIYYKAIKRNTQTLYEKLSETLQDKTSCITVGKKDPDVMMIGLHFDHFIKRAFPSDQFDEIDLQLIEYRFVQLMKYYIFSKCIHENLPLHMRRSFSFPESSLIEFGSALRLVVGLEDQSILEKYNSIIQKTSLELEAFLNSDNTKDMIHKVLLGTEEDFEKTKRAIIFRINKEKGNTSFHAFFKLPD